MSKPKVIFFGNGKLAEVVYGVLKDKIELVFFAKTKEDLAEVERIMRGNVEGEARAGEEALEGEARADDDENAGSEKIYGVLASFGVLIPGRILELFEPEGILNIHPSLLPDLRGPSPIETAILRGDTEFGVSVMKLAPKMDAGPIYYQAHREFGKLAPKAEIYEELGRMGAEWLGARMAANEAGQAGGLPATGEVGRLSTQTIGLPKARTQDEAKATYSKMLDTSMATLKPDEQTAEEMLDQVRAFSGFPKSRLQIFGVDCIILAAHLSNEPKVIRGRGDLSIKGKDGGYLVIDELQPAGRKAMDAAAFLNGYGRAG